MYIPRSTRALLLTTTANGLVTVAVLTATASLTAIAKTFHTCKSSRSTKWTVLGRKCHSIDLLYLEIINCIAVQIQQSQSHSCSQNLGVSSSLRQSQRRRFALWTRRRLLVHYYGRRWLSRRSVLFLSKPQQHSRKGFAH